MLFTTLGYVLFLPAAVAVFRLLRGRLRLGWLVLASLIFYATFGVANLLPLAAVAAITLGAGQYLLGPGAAHRRPVFWSGIAAILGLMGLLKYWDSIAAGVPALPTLGLTAPAGFSFYAFTAIALLIDRYREPADSTATPGQDLLYLAWFPKILAGPIERVAPFTRQLAAPGPLTLAVAAGAGQLILWGLFKKVVVADNLAPFVDRTYAIPGYAVPMELILASYFFAFQIYCDFSGYTDIARGSSRLFGIGLSENFRRSYFATSIGEFWSRRWHVSLADWFRDYVYYPFVGERTSLVRMYLGLMLVFILSGIWHAGLGYGFGWGFIVWGLLNGLYLWAERGARPWRRRLSRRLKGTAAETVHGILAGLVVFHLILVSWVFFRAGSIADATTILTRIWAALPEIPGLLLHYPFTAEHRFLVALIVLLLAIEAAAETGLLKRAGAAAPQLVRVGAWYALAMSLVLLGRWQSEAFVYMQF